MTGGSVLQVVTLTGPTMGVGDIRAILRSTVTAVEGEFGQIEKLSPRRKLSITLSLLNAADKKNRYANLTLKLAEALSKFQVDERHYWISTFYTLLMDERERRKKAIYFTPPAIVGHLIKQAEIEGLDLTKDQIVDPAAGGAAFISSLAGQMVARGCSNKDIRKRLCGFEIDHRLAELGEALVCDRLGQPYRPNARSKLLRVKDSLRLDASEHATYDAVFVNPPYGRLLGIDYDIPDDWCNVSSPGHINKYALFIGLALRLVKPGGLVAAVCPSSYIAGPLFGPLRNHIRTTAEVLRIDVLERKDVFHDVTQDACVAIFRRRKEAVTAVRSFNPKCGRIDRNWKFNAVGTAVPSGTNGDAPWVLPDPHAVLDDGFFHLCSGRLSDYGVTLKSGYFVWNREKDRLRKRRLKTVSTFPLIWATLTAMFISGLDRFRWQKDMRCQRQLAAGVLSFRENYSHTIPGRVARVPLPVYPRTFLGKNKTRIFAKRPRAGRFFYFSVLQGRESYNFGCKELQFLLFSRTSGTRKL
jgi:adenine-specific DNA-methyltransferase